MENDGDGAKLERMAKFEWGQFISIQKHWDLGFDAAGLAGEKRHAQECSGTAGVRVQCFLTVEPLHPRMTSSILIKAGIQ